MVFFCSVSEASLLNGVKDAGVNSFDPATSAYGGEPVSPLQIVAKIVNIVLGLIGIVFIVLAIYSGARWMTSQGNDEAITKAKNTLKNLAIGIIIIAAGYSISYFIVDRLETASGTKAPDHGSIQIEGGF
jgi:uncharacterized membrane protein YwzB